MPKTPYIFISHSSVDKERFVKQLAVDLRDAGAEVFYDEWSIKPSERLRDKISDGIRKCTHFLIIVSSKSVRSKWLQHELDQAMMLSITAQGPKIIPVIIGNVQPTSIPLDLLGVRWISFKELKGKGYSQPLFELYQAVDMNRSDYEVPLEEIRIKQAVFVREHLAGTLDTALFQRFWNKRMFAANWHKLLQILHENVEQSQVAEARANAEMLNYMLGYYQLDPLSQPRSVSKLIDAPATSTDGLLLGRVLHLANAFRVTLKPEQVLRLLSSRNAHVIHATCTYIFETGIELDLPMTLAILDVVESDDDEQSFFSGSEEDAGDPMVVDARLAAAHAVILADPEGLSRESIVEKVAARFPQVAADLPRIAMQAMMLSSFGGSLRTTVPGDAFPG